MGDRGPRNGATLRSAARYSSAAKHGVLKAHNATVAAEAAEKEARMMTGFLGEKTSALLAQSAAFSKEYTVLVAEQRRAEEAAAVAAREAVKAAKKARRAARVAARVTAKQAGGKRGKKVTGRKRRYQ